MFFILYFSLDNATADLCETTQFRNKKDEFKSLPIVNVSINFLHFYNFFDDEKV